MKQFTTIIAKATFSLKREGQRGRTMIVKTGDRFVVTSPEYNNKEFAKIDREKIARLNIGHVLNLSDINNLFEVEA